MRQSFTESVNWEWFHAHHVFERDGLVRPGPWVDRIIEHARTNGYRGAITPRGVCRIANALRPRPETPAHA